MSNQRFTGISFPIRLNNKGGLKMSSTSATDSSHIEESITQILGTELEERVMELYFGSSISSHIFDSTDTESYNLIRYEICETLKQFEPRIEVEEDSIEIQDKYDLEKGNFIYVTIGYTLLPYNSYHEVSVELGGE